MNEYTVAKYLRLSSEDVDLKSAGKTESNSIANQRDLLDSYIARMPELEGARILEFCDDGWSGKNFERPAVQEMLEKAKHGEIQCIIVKDLSRFGRDYLTVDSYIFRVFPFLDIRFISINDGFDSSRTVDLDSLDTSFRTLLYDYYSRDLSRKVRSAKRQRAQKGYFLSPFAPFGYVKDPKNKNRLVVDPPAAGVVKRIFRLAGEGMTTTQIAAMMNREAVPTPMLYKRAAGCSRTIWPCVHEINFWTDHTVSVILRDERYIGAVVYGKRVRDVVGSWHTVKVQKADWITVDGTHESIVTEEEYQNAQAAMREYTERDTFVPSGNILMGVIRCGVCGHRMRRNKAKHPYYYCRTPMLSTEYPCTEEHILEEDIQELLLEELHVRAVLAVEASRIWEAQNNVSMENTAAARKTLAALKEGHGQREAQSKELYEAFVMGSISRTEYVAQKAAIVKERDDIAEQIAVLEAKLDTTGQDGRLSNRFVESFQQYVDIRELTKEAVRDVVDSICIYSEGRFEIIWNYQNDYEKLLLSLGLEKEGGSCARK